ncbi:MAG: Flagellar biosynthetic protein flhB [Candidatus Magnetoglobus multicellularis str. Araruama]|uniref:Flagellar biosynthetic protein flhB n=1 Tax=Candidatus Magnetoglobus multicellularis str. Araruama TaxID=890399 RepID=A0A1V1PEN1_9BACT|nr:MAG: Flagellar biosynthetic protein flhB [Candidatus Magnetoglobus multicellularis str. Araruama]
MNQRQKAVALKYNKGIDKAPRVTAKGRGYIAEKIISLAKSHDIPIKEDPDLVNVLAELDLHDEIPPELYMVVAELLAFVYRMNQAKGDTK